MSDVVASGKAHADMGLSEGNAVVTKMTEYDGSCRTAASGAVLKGGGRHMVQFTTVRKGDDMLFGLIRADWDVGRGENAHAVRGHSFYYTEHGRRYPGGSDWKGMQTAKEKDDRIGLLLDLGAGSLTVYMSLGCGTVCHWGAVPCVIGVWCLVSLGCGALCHWHDRPRHPIKLRMSFNREFSCAHASKHDHPTNHNLPQTHIPTTPSPSPCPLP